VIDDTHDSSLRSWVESANAPETDFPIQNLPFGVFRRAAGRDAPRIGVAIGDQILDLRRAVDLGLLEGLPIAVVTAASSSTLNDLMTVGRSGATALRHRLVAVLRADARAFEPGSLVPMQEAELLLPAAVGDYTDFYASIFHATRVGEMFRPQNPLLPNYKHIPIAYHGRASTLVPGGAPVRRPAGQVKNADGTPDFRDSERLDYEMEIGIFVSANAKPLTMDEAEDHIFGLCIVNDWSARDIQAWEAQPLGPFLAKSFATSVSPWVVTWDALAPFRCPPFARPDGDPRPLPYLSSPANDASGGFDVSVSVGLRSAAMRASGLAPMIVCRSSLRDLYWTAAQLIAHHTSNGCTLRSGDLIATGTVSGPAAGSEGCLLERTRNGAKPIQLPTGESRAFLADGDEVTLRAWCDRAGYRRIGFGMCQAIVLPAFSRR